MADYSIWNALHDVINRVPWRTEDDQNAAHQAVTDYADQQSPNKPVASTKASDSEKVK